MTPWTGAEVATALGLSSAPAVTFTGVGTDTRTLEPGALFVALLGERFNAHAFLDDAVARGATGVVVRVGSAVPPGIVAFEVPDTLVALGRLAHARRRRLTGPVVAVTGTNGKTATKEMLACALGTRWRVHATRGNLNNLVGVPLTILDAPPDAEALVVEAGASVPGEVARLREIIAPDVGVITNVGPGHLEGFGSLDGVLAEKVTLVNGVRTAIVGTSPAELADRARAVAGAVVVAGRDDAAAVRPGRWWLDEAGRGTFTLDKIEIRLPLVGPHQIDNALLALAAAQVLGLPLERTADALAGIALPPGRCEVMRHGDLVIVHDAYNANPESVAAALQTAEALRGSRPLVVLLGSMLELGERSTELHAEVAGRVLSARPALVGAVGAFVPAFEAHAAELGGRLLTAPDPATLGAMIAGRLEGHELVLLKASRGVRLERALPHLVPDGD